MSVCMNPDRELTRKILHLLSTPTVPTNLTTVLSPLTPHLTRSAVLHVLPRIPSATTAFRFFLWSRRHLPLDDALHYVMLRVLTRNPHHLPLARRFLLSLHLSPPHDSLVLLHDRFFNLLLRAHALHGQIRSSVRLFREMKSAFGVPPSVFSYNSLLAAFFSRGRTVAAANLFDEMTAEGSRISPDLCTFNTMIRGFCLTGGLPQAFRYFRKMEGFGVRPDVQTYNTLLDGVCRAGKVAVAVKYFEGMKRKEVRPNVVTYTTLIRAFCTKGCVEDALGLFREMVEEDVKPNDVTYNTIIHGLCEAGEIGRAMEMFEGVSLGGEERGFRPDVCTFNTLINAHCTEGRVDDALKVFDTMPKLKLKPDSASYSVLICALCGEGDYEVAEKLLDDLVERRVLLRRGGSKPIMAAYNPIFEYLCQNGKTGKAGVVFALLLSKGIVDWASFKTLILGHCRESAFRDGFDILISMLRRNLVPDEETFQALFDGFRESGEMEFAWKVFEKMLNNGYRPKTTTFHSVLAWLLDSGRGTRKAGDLIAVMLERKVLQDIKLSTATVIGLYKDGLHSRGLEITHLLYESGYCLEMEKLVVSLCDNRKFLEARDLLLLSLEKHPNLPGEIYAAAIHGFCQIKRVDEAFKLFYELNETGRGHTVSHSLEDVEIGLRKEGKLEEAEFVRKRRNS